MRSKLLLIGFNTRALAESAASAGIPFVSVDCFGDLDHTLLGPVFSPRHPQPAIPCGHSLSLESLVAWGTVLAGREGCNAIVCAAGFENRPDLLQKLAEESGCEIYGSMPAALAGVRDAVSLSRKLRAAGFRSPETREAHDPPQDSQNRWLVKPKKSGGGHGIVPYVRGRKVSSDCLYQEYVEGVPCSFSFVSDGQQGLVLGVTEQLTIERCLTGRDFGFGGNLFPLVVTEPEHLLDQARDLATWLTTRFGLRGLSGVDCVLRNGALWVLEVNPRYCASMELFEWAYGVSMIELQCMACEQNWGGVAKAVEGLPIERLMIKPERLWAKKVIYTASREYVDPTLSVETGNETWARRLHERGLRDIPFPGELIPARRPVATALASGLSRSRCMEELESVAVSMKRCLRDPREALVRTNAGDEKK